MQDDYTPAKVIRGLERYQFLRVPLEPPERLGNKRTVRVFGGDAMEDQLCELADLDRVLFSLPDRLFLALCLLCLYRMPLDQIADALNLPQNTAGLICMKAAEEMAQHLGWRGYGVWYVESLLLKN